MRRMNPRDTEMAVLADVNLHRIIRRSTTYGAPYDPNALSQQDDETPRGLYFIFISAKAMATMEFLQQEWINNGNFMSLGEERDPNVGLQEDGATFTIPQEPVRRRIHGIETFNVLRGGEYFFMPSLSALRWIGTSRSADTMPPDFVRYSPEIETHRSGSRRAHGTDHRLLGEEGPRIADGRGQRAGRPRRAREDIRRGQGGGRDPAQRAARHTRRAFTPSRAATAR